jgi:hypothetical protein
MLQKPRSKGEGVRGEIMFIRCHKNILTVRDVCLLRRREGLSSVKQVAVLQTVGRKPHGVPVYTKVEGAGVVEFSVPT